MMKQLFAGCPPRGSRLNACAGTIAIIAAGALGCLADASTLEGGVGARGRGANPSVAGSGGVETASGGRPAGFGGDGTSKGGDATSNGGDGTSKGGDATSNGGDGTSKGGDATSSGGDATSDGGQGTSNGGDATSNGGQGGRSAVGGGGGQPQAAGGVAGETAVGRGAGGAQVGAPPLQTDPGDEGDGIFEQPGPYSLSPEARGPIDGAPKGQLLGSQTFRSPKIYSDWTFSYQIYVPVQYEAGKPAALAVFQDGVGAYGGIKVMQIFENLIHAGEMPVTIVLFIKPGSGGRSENYDSVSDRYGKMLLEEMIPEVLADFDIVDDPEGWAIAGFSSGGSAAFTAAWFFPDRFRKVSTNSGSFTALKGADKYPRMIRENAAKPLRVSLRSGTKDLMNRFGNWLDSNFKMADALKEQGYHYRFVHGTEGHDMKQAGQDMADEWRWLWRGFKLPYYE